MTWIVSIFMLLGSFFVLIAAIGVFRLPDIFTRMHAATKAGAFGATLLLIAAAVHFPHFRTIIMALLIVCFFYLTAPVAAQMLGRTAYRRGSELWDGTLFDEWDGRTKPTHKEPEDTSKDS